MGLFNFKKKSKKKLSIASEQLPRSPSPTSAPFLSLDLGTNSTLFTEEQPKSAPVVRPAEQKGSFLDEILGELNTQPAIQREVITGQKAQNPLPIASNNLFPATEKGAATNTNPLLKTSSTLNTATKPIPSLSASATANPNAQSINDFASDISLALQFTSRLFSEETYTSNSSTTAPVTPPVTSPNQAPSWLSNYRFVNNPTATPAKSATSPPRKTIKNSDDESSGGETNGTTDTVEHIQELRGVKEGRRLARCALERKVERWANKVDIDPVAEQTAVLERMKDRHRQESRFVPAQEQMDGYECYPPSLGPHGELIEYPPTPTSPRHTVHLRSHRGTLLVDPYVQAECPLEYYEEELHDEDDVPLVVEPDPYSSHFMRSRVHLPHTHEETYRKPHSRKKHRKSKRFSGESRGKEEVEVEESDFNSGDGNSDRVEEEREDSEEEQEEEEEKVEVGEEEVEEEEEEKVGEKDEENGEEREEERTLEEEERKEDAKMEEEDQQDTEVDEEVEVSKDGKERRKMRGKEEKRGKNEEALSRGRERQVRKSFEERKRKDEKRVKGGKTEKTKESSSEDEVTQDEVEEKVVEKSKRDGKKRREEEKEVDTRKKRHSATTVSEEEVHMEMSGRKEKSQAKKEGKASSKEQAVVSQGRRRSRVYDNPEPTTNSTAKESEVKRHASSNSKKKNKSSHKKSAPAEHRAEEPSPRGSRAQSHHRSSRKQSELPSDDEDDQPISEIVNRRVWERRHSTHSSHFRRDEGGEMPNAQLLSVPKKQMMLRRSRSLGSSCSISQRAIRSPSVSSASSASSIDDCRSSRIDSGRDVNEDFPVDEARLSRSYRPSLRNAVSQPKMLAQRRRSYLPPHQFEPVPPVPALPPSTHAAYPIKYTSPSLRHQEWGRTSISGHVVGERYCPPRNSLASQATSNHRASMVGYYPTQPVQRYTRHPQQQVPRWHGPDRYPPSGVRW
ncbi:uncharacterized protein VTP21DRAFT_7248 [Calcarisporiella thermophila]|uniref:uncharacterized protein n=1 Tax=Calcarisporiella thermophila TaxID=911321 RepID=UPI0037444E5F